MLESMSELSAEQSRSAHLLDEVPAGLARYDAEGRLIACNPELRRILGDVPKRLDELSFRPLFSAGQPGRGDPGREPRPLVQRVLAGETIRGEDHEVSPEVARGDGSPPRWVRVSSAPAPEQGGGSWLLMVD